MFKFLNLTAETRQLMATELDRDVQAGKVYMSPRLTAQGERDFVPLLREAMAKHDDNWLADQLTSSGRLKVTETYSTKTGRTAERAVRRDAHIMLSEGEFNRFYCRALCASVVATDAEGRVEVYRAKDVAHARAHSEFLIGQSVGAAQLLADLRENVGIETALDVPGGPGSGISVKLIGR